MLPLLTKLWPSGRSAYLSMGVTLAREQLCAVLLQQQGGDLNKMLNSENIPLITTSSVAPAGIDEIAAAIPKALANLKPDCKNKYLPVSVCMADPYLKLQLLDFDSLPRTKKSLDQLIRWRLAEKFHGDVSHLTYSYQLLIKDPLKPRVLVQAIDQELLKTLQSSFAQNNWQLESVDSVVSNQLNLLNRFDLLKNRPAALLMLHADYWTLLIWDQLEQPCYLSSQWRDQKKVATQHTELSAKLTHALTATAFSINTDIEYLYLLAADGEAESFMQAYTDTEIQMQDLTQVCVERIFAQSTPVSSLSLAAIAAAFLC